MSHGTALDVPVTPEDFRDAMSRWASGVTVVTTVDGHGRRYGFTANSFSSVSLRPPLILVCLDRAARCAPAFATAQWLAVHVLRRDQEQLAVRFAGRNEDKFAGLTVDEGLHELPLLPGTAARLECRIHRQVPAGDHTVLIAEVHRVGTGSSDPDDADPLVYHDRRFRRLA